MVYIYIIYIQYIVYSISLRQIQDAYNIETCKFEISSIKHRDTGSDHVAKQTPSNRLRSCCLAQFGTPSPLSIARRQSNHHWKVRRVLQLMYPPYVRYESDEDDDGKKGQADGEEEEREQARRGCGPPYYTRSES